MTKPRPGGVKSAGVVYEVDPSVGGVGLAVRAWSWGSVTSLCAVWSTAWASVEDARDFSYAYRRLLATRFPGAVSDDADDDDLRVVHDGRVWTVRRNDDVVRVTVGPAAGETGPKTSP